MAVDHLTKRALLSPTRRAILQYLQMHGECTKEELNGGVHGYASWRIVAGSEPTAHLQWLTNHLVHLRAQGYVSKRINDAGEVVYFAGKEPVTTPPPEPEAEEPAQTAAPRHINVMHGPTYQPAAWAPARAGAMDHAAVPSLMGAKRIAFRSAS